MAELDNTGPEPDAAAGKVGSMQGKKMSLMLGVLVIVAALGGGAFIAYSQYDQVVQVAASLRWPLEAEDEDAPPEFGTFWEVENMIVNPAHTDGRRYLMVNIALESKDGSVQQELEQKEVVIRDVMLRHLGQRTVDQLADVEQRAALKEDLRTAVNALIGGEVNRLYFTQFVLQ